MGKQKQFDGNFEANHARHREASKPHDSPESGKDAISSFYEELSELRMKYRIKDLYVIYNLAVLEKDDSETVITGTTGFGTQSLFEAMAACAYGVEKQRREEMIRHMLSSNDHAID